MKGTCLTNQPRGNPKKTVPVRCEAQQAPHSLQASPQTPA